MAVRIRMKKLGRKHRPYFRICAIDGRAPRDGRVLEELGTYDPTVPETDARAIFRRERVDYWLGVGAQPSEKVAVLLKKYGTDGTHVTAQAAALDRLAQPTPIPDPGKPASLPQKTEPAADAAPPAEAPAEAETPAAAEAEKAEAPPAAETEAPEPAVDETTPQEAGSESGEEKSE